MHVQSPPADPQTTCRRKAIAAFIAANGFAPSVRELAEQFHMTGPGMQGLLDRMQKRGRIKRVRGRAPTVELVRGTDA
jgi:DNA-binding MarR family transcriptional regulator